MRCLGFLLLAMASIAAVPTAMAAPILTVTDVNGTIGQVDVATGDVTVIGNAGVVLTDIAYDPSGNLFGISFTTLYSLDTVTGAASLIGETGALSMNSLVFGPDGTLYTAGFGELSTLDIATGAATSVGLIGFFSSGDLAFVDGKLLMTALGGGEDDLVELDTTTGAGTLVGEIGVGGMFGLASPDGSSLFGTSGTSVLSINPATGTGLELVDYGDQGLGTALGVAFSSEAQAPSVIPVPPALPMLLVAIGAIAIMRRRH